MSFSVSSYSNDNLASLLSEAQDNQMMKNLGASGYEATGLTYDEMLNYAPTSMTTMYPNPALQGFGEAKSMNPLFYVLGALALGYFIFRPKGFAY